MESRTIYAGMRFQLLFLAVILVVAQSIRGQSCSPGANLVQNAANMTPTGSDGLTHVTYNFVDSSGNVASPESGVSSAALSAISEWNALSSVTHVQFDAAPAGQAAGVKFQVSTDSQAGDCAEYSSAYGAVYYGPTFLQAVASGSATTIFAHELGHALGLADGGTNPNPPSIMNNPSNTTLPAACTTPVIPTTTVQQSDAAYVPTCTRAAQVYSRQLLSKAHVTNTLGAPFTLMTAQNNGESCTYEYSTLNFYVDGNFDSSEQVLTDVDCY